MENAKRIRVPTQLTPELTTGIEEIDSQHRHFLDLVQAAEDLSKNPASEAARTLLLEISRYAQCHFTYEETMMTVYDYPDRDQHVDQHAAILTALKRSIENDCVNLAQMRFQLLRWLMAHIPVDDKPLAQFVNARRPSLDDSRAPDET